MLVLVLFLLDVVVFSCGFLVVAVRVSVILG